MGMSDGSNFWRVKELEYFGPEPCKMLLKGCKMIEDTSDQSESLQGPFLR